MKQTSCEKGSQRESWGEGEAGIWGRQEEGCPRRSTNKIQHPSLQKPAKMLGEVRKLKAGLKAGLDANEKLEHARPQTL